MWVYVCVYARVHVYTSVCTCHSHTLSQHTPTFTYTRTHIHTQNTMRCLFTRLFRRISSSELNPQSCVLLLYLVLFCHFVHVRMYVFVCSFPLLSLICWRVAAFSNYQIVHGLPLSPFAHPDSLVCWFWKHKTIMSVCAEGDQTWGNSKGYLVAEDALALFQGCEPTGQPVEC